MSYTFTFPIRAISKDNEKIFNRQGRFFLSRRFKEFEASLKASYFKQKQGSFEVLAGDLMVDMEFGFDSKRHCDLFNLPKSVCDAFNGIIWKDDRQIKIGKLAIKYGVGNYISIRVHDLTNP